MQCLGVRVDSRDRTRCRVLRCMLPLAHNTDDDYSVTRTDADGDSDSDADAVE